jgi:hypothetical protein
MTQDTYRFAYEEASAELREILGQFEVLATRKEQMEQVVEALKVLLLGGIPAENLSASFPEQVPFIVHQSVEIYPEQKAEPAPEPVFEPAEEPVFAEQSSDPFQRRIDMALRHGFDTRESRILPRSLNGLLSRA